MITPVAGLALLIGLLLVALPGGSESPVGSQTTATEASPRDRLDPGDVVRAFLDAVNRGAIDEAKAYCSQEYLDRYANAEDSWLRQSVKIAVLRVGPSSAIPPAAKGLPPTYEMVSVPTDLEITQEAPKSIPNGRLSWSYTLSRSGPRAAWLILDQGRG